MSASRPQPRPGVLDIAPYVPGKSTAPGVAKVFKLSSNETPLGPSPKAIAAYRAVGEHLEDYPDGAASALREAIGAAHIPGASFIDLKAELDRLYSGYLHRALAASAAGFLAIVALLFAALRAPVRVARVMAPLAAGVAVVAAAHVLAGTRLSILHLVGLLLVVAVGSNYALFFDRMASRLGEAAPRTLASLVLANATTVASFGLIALSSIPVLHAIGSTVAPGALATLVFAAAFAPRPAARGP